MINPLWTEVATYTKTRKGKLRDTYRIYVNSLGWVKGHSDKHGKSVIFKSLEEMQQRMHQQDKLHHNFLMLQEQERAKVDVAKALTK